MIQQPLQLERLGLTLRGTAYLPAASRRFPAVLLLHGITGQRIGNGFMFVQLARALNKQGLAAVAFDFLHSGESDGSFDQMLVTGELDDALRMTQWLQGQPFADRSRLGILGFSLGGLVAACTVSRTDAYHALALIAPTTVDNICRFAAGRNNTDASNPVVLGPHTLSPAFFDDVRSLDPLSDCIHHPRPTLIVQGTADTIVPPAGSQTYADRLQHAGIPLTHALVTDGDHPFTRPQPRQQLIDHTVRFFAAHLR